MDLFKFLQAKKATTIAGPAAMPLQIDERANFYFYADKNQKAQLEKVEELVKTKGFETNLKWFEFEEGKWSLVAKKELSDEEELDNLEEEFMGVAEKYKIDYDGFDR